MTADVDRECRLWTTSLLMLWLPLLAAGLAELNGESGWLWSPVLIVHLPVPALDWLVGEDRANLPESAVSKLEADSHHGRITHVRQSCTSSCSSPDSGMRRVRLAVSLRGWEW